MGHPDPRNLLFGNRVFATSLVRRSGHRYLWGRGKDSQRPRWMLRGGNPTTVVKVTSMEHVQVREDPFPPDVGSFSLLKKN